jgi:hypothetical protein
MIATEFELKINEIMAEAKFKFKKLLNGSLNEQSKKEKELTLKLEQTQSEVEELKLELTLKEEELLQSNSENRNLRFELVRTNGAAWKEINSNSILNKIPNQTFDNLLKYLNTEDIRKVSITCDTTNLRVRNSFYQTLKSKVDDWSIYQDIRLCKSAREYLSFDYVSTDFQIGERPKIEGDIIVGDNFEVNDGAEVHDGEVEEEFVALESPVEYFNTDQLTDISLHCTWLSVKTFNLQHLTELYLLY